MLGGKFPNTKGMLGGNLGDAGWKLYGEVRKRPKYLNWEEFANITYYNIYIYISTHKVLV